MHNAERARNRGIGSTIDFVRAEIFGSANSDATGVIEHRLGPLEG